MYAIRSYYGLRPTILDDLGLESALRWHVEQFAAEMERFDIV